MAINLSLSNYKTDEILANIIKGNKRMLVPIFGDIAYLDCKVVNKDKCDIDIGAKYYIRTNIGRVKDILKRKYDKENQKDPVDNKNLTKLDDNTFEIIENEDEALLNSAKAQEIDIGYINYKEEKSVNDIQNKIEDIIEMKTDSKEFKPKSGRQFLLDLIEKNKTQK